MRIHGGNNMRGSLYEALTDINTIAKIKKGHTFVGMEFPFNMTIYDINSQLQPTNYEIVQVTSITPTTNYDEFAITRGQENTSAISHLVNKNVANLITWEIINAVHDELDVLDANIGGLTYTEQNYVTNGESLSDSVDSIDTNLKDVDDKIGDLSTLTTTEKGSVVGAVNELDSGLSDVYTKAEVDASLQEVTKYVYFDDILGEYVNLDKFWDYQRDGRIYTVEFNQYSVTPTPTGTKLDDNAGLVCEPSTNTVRGQNDYESIGLFRSIDVNAYVDENDNYHVTAIKGDSNFNKYGANGDVYVMAMAGYIKRYFDGDVWRISYSDFPYEGFEILDEAVKPDGTIRPYLLHAKYVAGRNPNDGELASISNVAPEYVNMSHNGQITEFASKGVQYSGKTSHDDFYVQLMFWLKYATTNSQSVFGGCSSYYVQYNNLLAETGVNRVVLSNANANYLLVGSTVSIGNATTTDRANASVHDLADRVKITAIVDLGDGTSAVYVDSVNPIQFDTTLSTKISTMPWNSGGCDDVLGQDGSPYNNLSNKEPFIINGIEVMVGGYEIIQNLIINNDNTGTYKIEVYACYDCHNYATSITSDYDLVGYQLAQTNNVWQYLSKIGIDNNNPSVIVPIETDAGSTTGFADGIYTNSPITGTRVWLSFGALSGGVLCGLRFLAASLSLASSYWLLLGRLSATGRSRRRS
jgi:hypothetical protein